jgi:hypothetical protein
LKVAQLRGILNEYQIDYPSNAKKSQLLALFEEHILLKQDALVDDYNNKINNLNNIGFVKGNKTPEPSEDKIINDDDDDDDHHHHQQIDQEPPLLSHNVIPKNIDDPNKPGSSPSVSKLQTLNHNLLKSTHKSPKSHKSKEISPDSHKSKKISPELHKSKDKSSELLSLKDKPHELKKSPKSKIKSDPISSIESKSPDTSTKIKSPKERDSSKLKKSKKTLIAMPEFSDENNSIDKSLNDNKQKTNNSEILTHLENSHHNFEDNLDISEPKDIIDHKSTPSKTFLEISHEVSPFSDENIFQSNDSKKRKRKSDTIDDVNKRIKSPPKKSIFDSDSEELEALSPQKTPFKIKRSKKTNNLEKIDDLKLEDKSISPKIKKNTSKDKKHKENILSPKIISKFDKIETPKLKKIKDEVLSQKMNTSRHQSTPDSSTKKLSGDESSNSVKSDMNVSSNNLKNDTSQLSFKSTDESLDSNNTEYQRVSNTSFSTTMAISKPLNDESESKDEENEKEKEDSSRSQRPGSIEEEATSFDNELDKINRKGTKSSKKLDLDLAAQLGITVEGYNPTPRKSTIVNTPKSARSLSKTSRNTTPKSSSKSTPLKLSKLTPKPRLQQITDANVSDDEDEHEAEKSFKGSTDSENIETKIANLEKSIEQESKKVIKKLKVNFKSLPLILTFITWLFLVSLGLFGYWYHQQMYLIGYCGHEINKATFPNPENRLVEKFGDYLDKNFKPNCVPCPNHARCFPNLELGCFEDFVEYKPWNHFLIPTKKRCIPDTKRAEKLEIMIEVALDLLRTKNARKNCGKSDSIEEAGVKLTDLHDLLLSMKAPYITTQEFEELWGRSISELEKEPDIIVRHVTCYESQYVY